MELVIAVGVISTATIAAITLIVRTVDVGQQSQTKTEATNYAREGLEVVRMIRDSNWLKRDQNQLDGSEIAVWDDNGSLTDAIYTPLGNAAGIHYYVTFNAAGDWQLLSCAGLCTATQKKISLRTQTVSTITSKFATQNFPAGTPTRYSREVTIVAHNATSAAPDPSAVGSLDYLDVTSTVTWSTVTSARAAVLKERLYNWK